MKWIFVLLLMGLLGFLLALLNGALAMWIVGPVFPQFGFWDWFRMCLGFNICLGSAAAASRSV